MKQNIWQKLKKPLFILAPMEDVTDTVFRQIIASCGKPDLFFTEFVNCDGLLSKGSEKVSHRLIYSKTEQPIIAQIWGIHPDTFYQVAKQLKEQNFAGIDINMGCPERKIVKQGACGGLISNPELAKKIIQATKKGAGNLPVSVKTRIGINSINTTEWISHLLDQNIDALTIHARTVKEQSKTPAHWDEIKKAVEIRDKKNLKTLIIGNGDVNSFKMANDYINKYSVDGVMIGRGIFTNPFIFNPKIDLSDLTLKQRLDLLLKHAILFEKTWKGDKKFYILRKYFKIYLSNFPQSHTIRQKFMETNSLKEVKTLVDKYKSMSEAS